jgi:ABC-type siderophore export system fused ATPase/permease subunit
MFCQTLRIEKLFLLFYEIVNLLSISMGLTCSSNQVEDGVLSTIDLSQGQRKRLALLTAFLEDRPIYVFDEWAADQDPFFRDIFYLNLLPELQARGKTILVISHDDRYYHLGNRLIKLDYGQVERYTSSVKEDGQLPSAQAVSRAEIPVVVYEPST